MTTGSWDYKLHRQIAEIGATMGPVARDAALETYLSMHPAEPVHPVARDLSYGRHERQRLDVHTPATSDGQPRPVLIFVHGGGFSGGDKVRPGQPFYDNIAQLAVSAGLIGVNITYRLAPDFGYPAGAEDVGAAFLWVLEHIAEHGGDPESVVVMGHSAGSAHVASFVADPGLRAGRSPAGAILSSGIYDPAISADGHPVYYGEDRAALAGRASVEGLCATEIPLLLCIAEFDPPEIQAQTRRLVDAYFDAHGLFPRLIQAEGHNHFTVTQHLGTDETWFSERLARFVEGVRVDRR